MNQTKTLAKQSSYWKAVLNTWGSFKGLAGYQTKVAVKVTSEEELLGVQKKAQELGIPCYVVADAGHTQIEAGSLTVCGIGPVTSS